MTEEDEVPKDKIREDALDELEEVLAGLEAKKSHTLGELGQIGRMTGILRRAKRIGEDDEYNGPDNLGNDHMEKN